MSNVPVFKDGSPDEVTGRVVALIEERKRLERELADARRQLALSGGGSAGAAAAPADEQVNGVTFSGQVIDGLFGDDGHRAGGGRTPPPSRTDVRRGRA